MPNQYRLTSRATIDLKIGLLKNSAPHNVVYSFIGSSETSTISISNIEQVPRRFQQTPKGLDRHIFNETSDISYQMIEYYITTSYQYKVMPLIQEIAFYMPKL